MTGLILEELTPEVTGINLPAAKSPIIQIYTNNTLLPVFVQAQCFLSDLDTNAATVGFRGLRVTSSVVTSTTEEVLTDKQQDSSAVAGLVLRPFCIKPGDVYSLQGSSTNSLDTMATLNVILIDVGLATNLLLANGEELTTRDEILNSGNGYQNPVG